MDSRRPVIGSFSTLIETETKKSTPSPRSPVDVLVMASENAKSDKPLTVSDLQLLSGLKLDHLGEFLSTLKSAGWVKIEGDWGRETISLTDLGTTVAQAASPR